MTEIREPVSPQYFSGDPYHPGTVVVILFTFLWLVGFFACIFGFLTGLWFLFLRFSRNWKHRNWEKEREKHPGIRVLMKEGFELTQSWNSREGYRYFFALPVPVSPEFKTLDELEATLSSSPEMTRKIEKRRKDIEESLAERNEGKFESGKEEALPTPV